MGPAMIFSLKSGCSSQAWITTVPDTGRIFILPEQHVASIHEDIKTKMFAFLLKFGKSDQGVLLFVMAQAILPLQ
jgi:hypothetical protein